MGKAKKIPRQQATQSARSPTPSNSFAALATPDTEHLVPELLQDRCCAATNVASAVRKGSSKVAVPTTPSRGTCRSEIASALLDLPEAVRLPVSSAFQVLLQGMDTILKIDYYRDSAFQQLEKNSQLQKDTIVDIGEQVQAHQCLLERLAKKLDEQRDMITTHAMNLLSHVQTEKST